MWYARSPWFLVGTSWGTSTAVVGACFAGGRCLDDSVLHVEFSNTLLLHKKVAKQKLTSPFLLRALILGSLLRGGGLLIRGLHYPKLYITHYRSFHYLFRYPRITLLKKNIY